MVSPRKLLHRIESIITTSSPYSSHRTDFLNTIQCSSSLFKDLLSFLPPKSSDRSELQSGEVKLHDSSRITVDDQDIRIASKLSDDLHLNEIECVRLLVSANQEWGLMGRDPLEIFRLAAGLWYTERRDIITSIYTMLRAVVLGNDGESDFIADIQKYLEDLFNSGLRQRFIRLIKEINREEPAGLGGPSCEQYIIDSRGALVERRAVICQERLILCHCLVFSVLITRISPNDMKDVFYVLKDSASELSRESNIAKQQITFSLLFTIVIAFISDALRATVGRDASSCDSTSVLSSDASFRREFQNIVMLTESDYFVEGFVGGVRLAWSVHLTLVDNEMSAKEITSNVLPYKELIKPCLDTIIVKNTFHFLLSKVLTTAAYQNGDEDMIYMYDAYLHKLITCFLSHDITREKVKEMKDKAMSVLSHYHVAGVHDMMTSDYTLNLEGETETGPQPFVSLLEFVKEIYEKEPELLSDNDVLWNFVIFAGEDHINVETLVAFLKLLSTLASRQEGASRVFELLDGNTFRSVGWKALFGCLSVYEERFRQCMQTKGAVLPDFQEGDAKALVAYVDILRKVVEHRIPAERENCFPDIEPLFKLLNYENVPPELKAALRNCIAVFAKISPALRDKIWSFLEQYDLPVVVSPQARTIGQPFDSQIYDMHYELNEIEAKREQYPSTLSFINLLNILIAEETDLSDRGNRFVGIFRFICDQVFGLFLHRAYTMPSEKWQLAVACLQHFHIILSMYDITNEDIETVVGQSQLSIASQLAPFEKQIPVVELLKDFMSGKTVFRNIMSILSPGVSSIVTQRTGEIYGLYLEKAVLLCLEIIILIFEKDILVSDFWRPFYQPLDVILAQDCNHIVTLLEYVRYDYQVKIQKSSVKIMRILSARMPSLVQVLLKSNAANALVEDYAACLELRSEESQLTLTPSINDDIGVLILQLLIDNINRPVPNVTHLLLKFDLDGRIERTALRPKFHYSCLKVILDMLKNLLKPDVNAFLYELNFQLLYQLCLDPLTSGPVMDLLNNKMHHFFVKHLDTIGISPLPKRSDQALRISALHQRAWFLKLLAVGLHASDMSKSVEREACQAILEYLLGHDESTPQTVSHFSNPGYSVEKSGSWSVGKSRVLKLLEVVQFRIPDILRHFEVASSQKFSAVVNDILANSTSEKGGVYYFSERGDRLIDLTSFRDKLSQKLTLLSPQLGSPGIESELKDVKETIKGLLKWGWKYNKNLEEQAAQLHMLTSWSQVVEIAASRRLSSLENQSDILLQLLDSTLTASASQDCSLKMALILTQVAATCMSKLRDERFVFPGGISPDNITCLDILMGKQLPNSSCQSVLLKLVAAILRPESSEPLRRRQYALLLSYFQFCQHMLNLDVPETVLQFVFLDEQHGEDQNLIKIDREQAELMRTNFVIIRKEAQAIFDLVVKDATKGSETGKTISFYVLDALIAIDHETFFLSQIQSRGVLRSCLIKIGSLSNLYSSRSPQDNIQQVCTLQAEFALLLRICVRYGRSGAQILSSMRILEHISSCKAVGFQANSSLSEIKIRKHHGVDIDKAQMVVVPILRLVFALTSLLDTSDYFDVKNKIVRESVAFVKGRQYFFDQILHENTSTADESTMEQVYLVVAILTKVWPYEENDEYGLLQGILSMTGNLFSLDFEALSFSSSDQSLQNQKKLGMYTYQICFCLSSYIHFLVSRKSFKLEVLVSAATGRAQSVSQPITLNLLGQFVGTVTVALEKAIEERSLLLNKIREINELSRQEVDEIITVCERQDYILLSDNMQKRRYVAMVEMCRAMGSRDHVISLLLPITENLLNVILLHFQDSPLVASEAATRLITHDDGAADDKQKTGLFYGNLISTLERLESLCEMLEKMRKNMKLVQRLIGSVKEMALQRLTF